MNEEERASTVVNPLASYEEMWAERYRELFDRVAAYFPKPEETTE